jgi:hypothetical protein
MLISKCYSGDKKMRINWQGSGIYSGEKKCTQEFGW